MTGGKSVNPKKTKQPPPSCPGGTKGVWFTIKTIFGGGTRTNIAQNSDDKTSSKRRLREDWSSGTV